MTDLTDSPAFQRWFGDSKVVDVRGRPLVVYHGTPDARGLFVGGGNVGREGKWEPVATERPGFRQSPSRGMAFFAVDRHDMARTYADARRAFDYQGADPAVVPLYLSIQNPLMVDAEGKSWRGTERTVEEARSRGHDGVIILRSVDYYNESKRRTPATVYVFFEPTQAKSALTGALSSLFDRKPIPGAGPNVGTFDPSDPDLTRNMQRNPALDRFNFIEKTYGENQPWVVVDTLSAIMPTIGIDNLHEACDALVGDLIEKGEWRMSGMARHSQSGDYSFLKALFSATDGDLRPALYRVFAAPPSDSDRTRFPAAAPHFLQQARDATQIELLPPVSQKQALTAWAATETGAMKLAFDLIKHPSFDERFREPHQADGIFPWIASQLSKLSKAVLQSPALFVEYKSALRLLRKRGNAIAQWAKQTRVDIGKKTLAEVLEATADFKVVATGRTRQGRVDYEFADGWTIQELRSKRELEDEGRLLQHCVGGYCKDVESGKSQIFSLRDPDGNPIATAEWQPPKVVGSLSRGLATGHFQQIFGAKNEELTDARQIERFVEWIHTRFPGDASGELLLGIKVFSGREITLPHFDDASIEHLAFTRCKLLLLHSTTFEHGQFVDSEITMVGPTGSGIAGLAVAFDGCNAPRTTIVVQGVVRIFLGGTIAPDLVLRAASKGSDRVNELRAVGSDVSRLRIEGDLAISEITSEDGSSWDGADLFDIEWASISQRGKSGTTFVKHESFEEITSSGAEVDKEKVPLTLRSDETVDEGEFESAMSEMDDDDYEGDHDGDY